MTVFRKGMAVACVDDHPCACCGHSRLKVGRVYRIVSVEFGQRVGSNGGWNTWPAHLVCLDIGLDCCRSGYWLSERFRPLVDEEDDAELIAKIKACKPVRALAPNRHERTGY